MQQDRKPVQSQCCCAVRSMDLSHPEVDDVLDDLGERVAKTGGDVVMVPAERMPTRTGAAAIYRF